MSRAPADRLRDIEESIAAIRRFERSGRDDPMVFDAVRMRLLEIGEAAGGIPAEVRATEPDIPWREIIGMRNWMAHRYFDTVHAYVWGTVDHDLEPLVQAVQRMRTRITGG